MQRSPTTSCAVVEETSVAGERRLSRPPRSQPRRRRPAGPLQTPEPETSLPQKTADTRSVVRAGQKKRAVGKHSRRPVQLGSLSVH